MFKYAKLRIALLAATILLMSNSLHAQSMFEQMGVSFNVPAGWEVGELEKAEGSVYFTCERKGGQGTEVAAFSIVAVETDLDEYVQGTMAEYEKSIKEAGAKVSWNSGVMIGTIGMLPFETSQASFTVTDETGQQEGIIIAFKACGNTVLLILSGEKNETSDAAFNTIKESLLCE